MKKSSFKRSLALFMAILMLVTSVPILAFATSESGTKPADSSTDGQPFITDSPSKTYRIPAMTVLDSGTIVAVGEARWDGGMDGGGNDTMVARSTDNGLHWENTFINYYPDNGNVFNTASTGTCDHELVTDGKNLYLLTTFFPAGYALNSSSADHQLSSNNGTAFVTVGNTQRVKLTNNGGSSYDYYIGDFDKDGAEGRAKILSVSDSSETGYTVDHDYYLYQNGSKLSGQNLFYSDATYQTAKVNFLLFRKSTDEGKTWSDFTPVPAKNSSEAFFGVGPGCGVYDEAHNRLIFSTYTWNGSGNSQRSSFVYTDDEGKTWHRSPDFPELKGAFNGNWSSENAIVQLDDNTLRCFVRNGWKRMTYADAVWNGSSYTWQSYKDGYLYLNGTPGTWDTGSDSGCQLSAIKYSKQLQYNGNYYDAILLSTPRGSRSNGVIYTLLIDKDHNIVNLDSSKKNMDKQIMYSVNNSYYGYSSIAEANDGSIYCLYEINNATGLLFSKMPEVAKITGLRVPKTAGTYNITLPTGTSNIYTVTAKGTEGDTGSANISYKERKSVNAQLGDDKNYTGATIPLEDALFDFTRNSDGSWNIGSMGVYMTVYSKGYPSTVTKSSVSILQDENYFKFVDSDNEALFYYRTGDSIHQFDQTTAYGSGTTSYGKISDGDGDRYGTIFEVYRPAEAGEDADNNTVPGFVRITSINDIKDGGKYLIGCSTDDGYSFVYPSTSTNNTFSHSAKMIPGLVDAGYTMTVEPYKAGECSFSAGEDVYNFTFVDYSNEILGVVDYDPVIYTHGSFATTADMNFTTVGEVISDGQYTGEKTTYFRFRNADYDGDGVADNLADKFNLLSVSVNGDSQSKITYTYDETKKEYLLHGSLYAANTTDYTDFTKGQYVEIKTMLEEKSTGEVYTQTDKLYVASNPVPGHVIAGIKNWKLRSAKYYEAEICTYLLAPESIGNSADAASLNINYKRNAKHIFDWTRNVAYDQNDANQMVYKDRIEDITQADSGNAMIKLGGAAENSKDANYEISLLSADAANSKSMAVYYYDKSSPKNEGVTSTSADGSSFSIYLQRKLVDVDGTDRAHINDIRIGINDRTYIEKLSGTGTIEKQTYMYSEAYKYETNPGTNPEYYEYSSSKNQASPEKVAYHERLLEVKCTAADNAVNNPLTLKGVFRLQEGNDTAECWNDMRLPFEIRICDKSDVRDAYNNSIKNVLKSTDYTATTWETYMNNALTAQEYLNNYIIQTKEQFKNAYNKDVEGNGTTTDPTGNVIDVPTSYQNIQKSAQFSPLKDQIEEKQQILDAGIEIGNNAYYTPSTFVALENQVADNQAWYDNAGVNGTWVTLPGSNYTADEVRSEIPGWTIGPYSTKKEDVQNQIEDRTKELKNQSVKVAADDSAYVAVKDLYSRIDTTAYTDKGASIEAVFTEYDKPEGIANDKIYAEYNNKTYVDVPADFEGTSPIDAAVASALTEMNVAAEKANVKQYNVSINANGAAQTVEGVTGLHNYGEIVYIDFKPYFDAATQNIECVVTSYRENESGERIPTTTTANLSYYADKDYIVPVLIQNDIEFTVIATDKAVKQATIVDYYGTVIGTLTGDTVTVDTASQTVTDGSQTINAKNSPKYSFTRWSLDDGTYPITEGMVISQFGTLIPGACQITAQGGKVNTLDVFNSNQLDLKLTFTADNPNAIWTRTVDGKETLASYEANFVNFSSGADVLYKAYDSIDALPSDLRALAESNTPAVNAVGYTANGKFTLSVDYSAPNGVEVLDSGIIFTNTNPENLYKGGEGTTTYASPRIAHWSTTEGMLNNSGTFTMSKSKNIDGAYMRAYVSYTLPYGDGTTIPYVVYSDTIYKCELQSDGSYKVTAVK